MKLVVDRKACLKSGQCTYLHPELFTEGSDGYPETTVDDVKEEMREAAEEAIDLCPASAIALEE